jgi:hypothetical protein
MPRKVSASRIYERAVSAERQQKSVKHLLPSQEPRSRMTRPPASWDPRALGSGSPWLAGPYDGGSGSKAQRRLRGRKGTRCALYTQSLFHEQVSRYVPSSDSATTDVLDACIVNTALTIG